MNYSDTQNIILDAITQYGLAVLGIISAIIVIALAYLVYKVGISRAFNDQSLMVGGYYLRSLPYKGYNRFRSRKWNMEHSTGFS